MAFDYKREYREFYLPKEMPEIVTVPPMNYVAVRGCGDPNQPDGEYRRALAVLYAVAYTIKMSKLTDHRIDGYFDYVVPPLEGFWWTDDGGDPVGTDKSQYNWISMIRLPEFVTPDDLAWAIQSASEKKGIDCSSARFMTCDEGLCVQIMHIGDYDREQESIMRMREHIAQNGMAEDLTDTRRHHEIYLSDARRVPRERWKTVIRHPIKSI